MPQSGDSPPCLPPAHVWPHSWACGLAPISKAIPQHRVPCQASCVGQGGHRCVCVCVSLCSCRLSGSDPNISKPQKGQNVLPQPGHRVFVAQWETPTNMHAPVVPLKPYDLLRCLFPAQMLSTADCVANQSSSGPELPAQEKPCLAHHNPHFYLSGSMTLFKTSQKATPLPSQPFRSGRLKLAWNCLVPSASSRYGSAVGWLLYASGKVLHLCIWLQKDTWRTFHYMTVWCPGISTDKVSIVFLCLAQVKQIHIQQSWSGERCKHCPPCPLTLSHGSPQYWMNIYTPKALHPPPVCITNLDDAMVAILHQNVHQTEVRWHVGDKREQWYSSQKRGVWSILISHQISHISLCLEPDLVGNDGSTKAPAFDCHKLLHYFCWTWTVGVMPTVITFWYIIAQTV